MIKQILCLGISTWACYWKLFSEVPPPEEPYTVFKQSSEPGLAGRKTEAAMKQKSWVSLGNLHAQLWGPELIYFIKLVLCFSFW